MNLDTKEHILHDPTYKSSRKTKLIYKYKKREEIRREEITAGAVSKKLAEDGLQRGGNKILGCETCCIFW